MKQKNEKLAKLEQMLESSRNFEMIRDLENKLAQAEEQIVALKKKYGKSSESDSLHSSRNRQSNRSGSKTHAQGGNPS